MTDLHDVAVSLDVMVAMRDGVRLATDIYRPALPNGEPAPGRFPVLLTRTSYDKSNPVMQVEPVGKHFARRGYVVAIQDLRGRGNSEGTGDYHHRANAREGLDGADTIAWLAAQPWSNGRVGMVGSSHSGCVQNVAALHRPPALKALWVDVAPITAHGWESRSGGAQRLHMVPALFLHAYDAAEIRDDPVARKAIEDGAMGMREFLQRMPYKRGHTPLAAVPNLEAVLMRYQNFDGLDEWWREEVLDQASKLDRYADVPTVFSSGWYDCFVTEVTWQFAEMAKRSRSPQRLVVGPWNHGGMRGGASRVAEVEFGAEAAWGYDVYNRERLRWFDRWLKDAPTGVEADPPVRLFVMGGGEGGRSAGGHLRHGGRWMSATAWPPREAAPTDFHLTGNGALVTRATDVRDATVSWTHDPANPVPTIGAAVAAFFEWAPIPEGCDPAYISGRARMRAILPDGPMHQRERPELLGCKAPYPLLAQRPDVQVFQTAPLAEPIEIAGPASLRLFVSSSAPDTDFVAKLIDVHPPTMDDPEGFQMNLGEAILRMRFRDGLGSADARPMEPGAIYEIEILLPPTANLFAKGHRIRVDVASSSWPHFDVNPSTGEPLGRHTQRVPARNTVHVGANHRSRLTLSVISR
ncbi:MAG: CocE/NonD family hydrolase [Alphaproteobacteria bacterium]|nr:CocE/NonD family hydrolase [Alphaproteobacteria bacterium]